MLGTDEAEHWVRGWEETGEDAPASGTMFDSEDTEEMDPSEVASGEID